MAKWNPSLHPRGPDGRFTKSSARPATGKQKARSAAARKGFTRRPPFRTPADAAGFLSGLSAQKGREPGQMDRMLAQLRETNRSLRAGKPAGGELEAAVKPTTEDVTVFRTVPARAFGDAAPQDLRGFIVRDAGFFPASAAPVQAQPGDVRMRIDVPAGTPAVGSPDTSELVLGPGVEMSIDEVSVDPAGVTDMHLTALPDGGADSSAAGEGEGPSAAGTDAGFDSRMQAAATESAARDAAPASLERDSDPPLTDTQRAGLERYRSEEYRAVNHVLRGGSDADIPPIVTGLNQSYNVPRSEVDAAVAAVDSAMDQSRLTSDAQVFRGLADASLIFGDRVNGDLTGMQWREDAYVSTTSSREIADDFAGNLPPGAVMMRVLVPKGVGGIELSDDSYEAELLLQRGLTMRVVADRGVDEDGVRQIDVEVVPVDAT